DSLAGGHAQGTAQPLGRAIGEIALGTGSALGASETIGAGEGAVRFCGESRSPAEGTSDAAAQTARSDRATQAIAAVQKEAHARRVAGSLLSLAVHRFYPFCSRWK